ncbi:hypothetical protein HYDPIDRAFT_115914 [Hydnomerulius pinastri MD-312]|uniref:F-box domain-containing protein n=1 Tax=Hydnomerulius pinastri MD-312 TaxID=994086 RepID=A0A0C9W4M0_9AGAM|nr:hypothetical protein HYDPIDRAFT_115914 [Hydnomerulius pinastri MD-312]
MHRCLLIPELVCAIIAECDADPPHWGPDKISAQKTMASLARTCRIFKDPALDILWAHMSHLSQLILCLPIDAWMVTEPPTRGEAKKTRIKTKLCLTRPLTESDWEIILSYTCRVRSLVFMTAERQEQTLETLLRLFDSPTTPPLVFPNLRTFTWHDKREGMLPCLPRCLSPTLAVLSFNFRSQSRFPWSSLGIQKMVDIVGSLAHKTPDVIRFWCTVPPPFDPVEMFSGLICGWTRLTVVGMPIPNTRALLHLASLSLRKLFITIPPTWEPIETTHGVSVQFPDSLEELRISGRTFAPCAHFLARLHAAPVSVGISSRRPYTGTEIQELAKVLSAQLSHQRLQELHVGTGGPEKDASHVLELKDLEPLSRFTQLKDLDLNELCLGNIGDGDIHHLVSAWPRLVRFLFGAHRRSPAGPRLSIIGLQSVLTQCPMLETLALPVDFHFSPDMIITAEQPYSGVVHTRLRNLHVGYGSCNDPKSVAALLYAMLPPVHVRCVDDDNDDDEELLSRIAAWVEVEYLLDYDFGTTSTDSDEDPYFVQFRP